MKILKKVKKRPKLGPLSFEVPEIVPPPPLEFEVEAEGVFFERPDHADSRRLASLEKMLEQHGVWFQEARKKYDDLNFEIQTRDREIKQLCDEVTAARLVISRLLDELEFMRFGKVKGDGDGGQKQSRYTLIKGLIEDELMTLHPECQPGGWKSVSHDPCVQPKNTQIDKWGNLCEQIEYNNNMSKLADSMNYYLLVIHGDVEPELMGPFDSSEERDQAARNHRKEDPNMNDGLFRICSESPVEVDAFAGLELDEALPITIGEVQEKLAKAIKKFGAYQFFDKGPREVMDIAAIGVKMRQMTAEQVCALIRQIDTIKSKDGRGRRLAEELVFELDDWDEIFEDELVQELYG